MHAFTGNPLKDKLVAESAELRLLLEASVSEKPAKCQKQLCCGGFHATRKEVENYRSRQKAAVRAQGLPTLGVEAMLARLTESDFLGLDMQMDEMVRTGLNRRNEHEHEHAPEAAVRQAWRWLCLAVAASGMRLN